MSDTIRYTLTHPMIITARLLPGARIGDYTISVEPIMWDGSGYTCAYWIDGPNGTLYSGQDISVRMRSQEDTPREAISVLCSFLSNDGEVYAYGSGKMGTAEPIDGYAFNAEVAAWAYGMSDELSILAMELDGEVAE